MVAVVVVGMVVVEVVVPEWVAQMGGECSGAEVDVKGWHRGPGFVRFMRRHAP